MPRIVQHRRGTTAEVAGITGAAGELFVDTSKVTLVVMDGVLQGGVPLATETSVTYLSSTVVGVIANVNSVSSVANQAAVAVSSVSSIVALHTSQISSVSSAVANISVPTGTTTTLGIVRPDNSSINISANGVLSLGSSITSAWTIQELSGSLVFYHNGTAKLKFNSNGSIVAVDNITAYGTV
jgi:hypothetical protein